TLATVLPPERRPATFKRTGCPGSADPDDGPADDPALQVGIELRRQLVEGDGAASDLLQLRGLQVRADALPHGQSHVPRGGDGIDAEQVHAAKDERHDRGLELRAAGQADARDVAPEVRRPGAPRAQLPADVVDRAGPQRLLARPRPEGDVLAPQHARRAELPEVVVRIRLAADRDDLIATPGEHVDRETADAARGARDDDRSSAWLLAVLLHAMHGERRGE